LSAGGVFSAGGVEDFRAIYCSESNRSFVWKIIKWCRSVTGPARVTDDQ